MIKGIVCVDNNWAIGKVNKETGVGQLLFSIPADMKFFRETTKHNIVVMGKATYDSLPKRPLPGRVNVILWDKATSLDNFANKFKLRDDITHNFLLVQKLEEFLKLYKIEVAGVEFIESDNNEFVIYDINTNTNYNKAVEQSKRAKNELGAADRIVEFLESEFKKEIR